MSVRFVYIYSSIMLFACGPTEKWSTLGEVTYHRGGELCTEVENHWLLDLKATNSKDSVYLNTALMGRKLELHRLQLDSTSTVYKLLSETCVGDSLKMKLTALYFYESLRGKVPLHLADSDKITVQLNIVDKLTDREHIMYKKAYESDAISRYIERQGWNIERDSASGIVFERLKKRPESSDVESKAKVGYVIKSFNEQLVARSTVGDPLLYDRSDKGILKGIHILMSKLREGESLRAIVPSDYAYGATGNTRVPGYMPILIELEVLEIID